MAYQLRFRDMNHVEKLKRINPKEDFSPFSKFIGNDKAVTQLGLAAYTALSRTNHCCNDHNFALLGPSSVGKTTLARLFAEVLGLPFCEIHPKSIKSVNDILVKIAETCEETYTTVLEEDDNGNIVKKTVSLELELFSTKERSNYYIIPPIVVFIDEVHDLKDDVVQGLLKATEPNDRMMYTEKGCVANTHNICWMIATTDRGILFDAFDNRFTKVYLQPYTKLEVAKIIKLKYNNFDKKTCKLIAKYAGNVPREALSFATDVELMANLKQSENWPKIIVEVAKMRGIDRFGLTEQRLNILTQLGQLGPISIKRLCHIANCKVEELEKFVLPTMLTTTADTKALITVTPRGYTITHDGLKELDKRNIKHLGLESMPENLRGLFFERFGNRGIEPGNN